MPPKSKPNSKKGKKTKKRPQVKKPTRNWLELPSRVTMNILQRVGVIDILENVQKVCTAWREICKNPAMWSVIYIDNFLGDHDAVVWEKMCKHAVDRSQGQLVDLRIIGICEPELLRYVAKRNHIKRLEIAYHSGKILSEAIKKFSLLEELSLVGSNISQEDIETAGRYWPLLKSLKLHGTSLHGNKDDEVAFAIGKHLHELTNLEIIRNKMTNTGLQAILDGCCHLESVDLRGCKYLDLRMT